MTPVGATAAGRYQCRADCAGHSDPFHTKMLTGDRVSKGGSHAEIQPRRVGAARLSRMCRELEDFGRSNLLGADVELKLAGARVEFEQVRQLLEELRASAPPDHKGVG